MASEAEAYVATLLGGHKVLGGITEAADLLQAVRQGLPYASLEALTDALEAELGDVSAVIGLDARTLARRKHERQLSPIESDRLYRVAYVIHLATSTLGGLEKAGVWLQRDNRTLGGHAPLSLLDTEIGGRQVKTSTLGGLEKAGVWLQRDNRTLGGHAPLSLLDTEIGGRQVKETLLQLNHGIYA